MRETYGDLHHGKYSDAMAHYMDVNLGPQDFDDDASLENWGDWCGIIGRRVLFANNQGFVTLFTLDNRQDAEETFSALTAGWHADDEEEAPEEITNDPTLPTGTLFNVRGSFVAYAVNYVESTTGDVLGHALGDNYVKRFARDDVRVIDTDVCACGDLKCPWF